MQRFFRTASLSVASRWLLIAAGALSIATPAAAQVYIDTVNSFSGGSGFGVYDNSATYTGPSGAGTFDPSAVTSLDGSALALGGGSGPLGQIVVSFSTGSVIDGVGNDLRIFDTFGLSEGLTVEASADGLAFFAVGMFGGNFSQSCSFLTPCASSFDLNGSGLAAASFFRLTAIQSGCVGGFPECYDLDTVEALNFSTSIAAVPEPATWAMMLLGFGGIGYSLRRRRKQTAFAQFA